MDWCMETRRSLLDSFVNVAAALLTSNGEMKMTSIGVHTVNKNCLCPQGLHATWVLIKVDHRDTNL